MEVSTINYFLALGTLAMQMAAAALLVLLFLRKHEGFSEHAALVGRWGLWAAFLLSSTGMVMAVYYSDILGVEPCSLCWWQRIFQFPLVVLFGMALYKREMSRFVIDYSIVMSVIGGAFALYHHALQMFPNSLPCPSTGVSCAQRTIFEFGYITFPLMAFSLFAILIVLMLFVRKSR